MEKDNQSCLTEFLLLGFSDFKSMEELVFCLVLIFYLMTLMGNSLVLTITISSPTLHTPMYFFLWNLSFLEIGYASTISPKMLVNLLSGNQTISFWGCGCQMCFFLLFIVTECFLLCAMAFDRYVAICKPLQYPYIMNDKNCANLAAISWTIAAFGSLAQSISIFTLPFCGSNRISHFFCDITPVFRLTSIDTYKNELANAILTVVLVLVPLLFILFTYILIISSILRMPVATNRHKAFSTCSSHLTVVLLYYGTIIAAYIQPDSANSQDNNRFLALLYTVVTPGLNPIIYSLRNKEIKAAFKTSIARKWVFLGRNPGS
ncbi:olfactory receptor 2G3-like [Thamnophis elegans]|uniref:olfactory receptor 2G3-like n=1 Tax=Thamnophis elegans TaxID=35005 RepID=UPI0013779CB1|nr:olfactory receptor 2G3-like [Thamnophis elegans]